MSKKVNAVFVSYDGMTDPLGQSQVIPYVQGLSNANRQFTIVSFEKEGNYQKLNETIRKKLTESNIRWEPLTYHNKVPVLSILWNVFVMMQKVKQLHREKKIDVLHCRSYIAALAGLHFKKQHDTPFIFDMRGFFADERLDAGLWPLTNPLYKAIYKYFKRKEIEFVQQAGAIVSLTQKGKFEVYNWPGMSSAKEIQVIPCCTDMELFSRKSTHQPTAEKIRAELNSDLVISYIGSVGGLYMMNEMLDFFSLLKLKIPQAKFMILTPGNPQDVILAAKSKNLLPTDLYIRFAQRTEIPTYLSVSDWALFFIRPTYSKKASSPTKHAEIMSMGLPLITNTGIGDMDTIISQTNSGFAIQQFNHSCYHQAIEYMLTASIDKKAIREQCERIYSLKKGVELYENVYKKLGL